MIVSEIKFDKVTLQYASPREHDESKVYEGCMVSLGKDGSVSIQVSGDASATSWYQGSPIVMTNHKLVEVTPWSLEFTANMAEGRDVRAMHVVCEFNMFVSVSTRARYVRQRPGQVQDGGGRPRYAGNRVCPSCGSRKPESDFHGHRFCGTCSEEALKAYHKLGDCLLSIADGERLLLVPSKRAYMQDYLERRGIRLGIDVNEEVERRR